MAEAKVHYDRGLQLYDEGAYDGARVEFERAYELARPTGVVLLAPACASFDMFRDYAERGRIFKGEVKRIVDMANG